jgi:hypothetical protein
MMARLPKLGKAENRTLLTAALEGLELQKARIDEQIRLVRGLLGGGVKRPVVEAVAAVVAAAPGKRRRALSVAARKRIAAAQKKRWAEYRKKLAGEK